jgi:hypothetical protein
MKSLILGAGCALLAAVARPAVVRANLPDPYYSTVDPVIVAGSSGNPIGTGFRVTLRDIGGTPLGWHEVHLIFTNSGVRPYAAQDSATSVDCTMQTVTKQGDGNGTSTFYLRAGGFTNGGLVEVRGEGILIAKVPARSTDLDADGTTDIRDVALFRDRLLGNRLAPETDFNADGVTDVRDLNILRSELFSGARGERCP